MERRLGERGPGGGAVPELGRPVAETAAVFDAYPFRPATSKNKFTDLAEMASSAAETSLRRVYNNDTELHIHSKRILRAHVSEKNDRLRQVFVEISAKEPAGSGIKTSTWAYAIYEGSPNRWMLLGLTSSTHKNRLLLHGHELAKPFRKWEVELSTNEEDLRLPAYRGAPSAAAAAQPKNEDPRRFSGVQEIHLRDFAAWRARIPNDEVVHLKGFGCSMGDYYDEEAMEKLDDCSLLIWDGEEYSSTGFTKLIPAFLKGRAGRKAAAFCLRYEVDEFQKCWSSVLRGSMLQVAVVLVDAEPPKFADAEVYRVKRDLNQANSLPDWAAAYLLLSRIAMKASGAMRVVALGGGNITAMEAQLSVNEGVKWTIFALSRGRKETYPSLLDWAVTEPRADFVTGKDPNEAQGFEDHENDENITSTPEESTILQPFDIMGSLPAARSDAFAARIAEQTKQRGRKSPQ
eukprot:CAMPEP_0117577564 /NCGR_PEP_ID=MMETSP0784-20121206/63489_1 /TAXON_ID=39447 /ORGANISM="" /LENGTH=460 /DNA_ID=CAMNT_0005377073 /DNA_START=156 /DNA_END=1538 /DNA_ORIENTATION=-